MGMYDTISIDNKWLPEPKRKPYEEQDYQTKNLECALNLYNILEDGRLILVSDIDREGEIMEPVDYTGEMHFYDMEDDFKAWCVNGVVKEVIDLVPSS